MKLEITTQQFYQIQNEIIRLEEDLTNNWEEYDPWGRDTINRKITMLKGIVSEEMIDLYEMNY